MNKALLFAATVLLLAISPASVRAQIVAAQAKRLVLPDTPQNVRLVEAVQNADLAAAQVALNAGASADATAGWEGDPQQTPVALVAAHSLPGERQKSLPLFRLLVEHVHNPNAADTRAGGTLLMVAADLNDLPSVTHLVEAGADVNARQKQFPAGATALHAALMPEGAVAQDPSAIVLFLLAHGANADAADADGMTPLMLAAQFGKPATARALLARGADPAARDHAGRTALRWAALSPVRGAEQVIAILQSRTPLTLHEAAQFGDAARVRACLDAGDDPNAPDAQGLTPLMSAAKSGSVEVARVLLHRGADVHARRADGSTALHSAALYGDAALAALLLDRGADVNAVRGAGPRRATPLSIAVGQGQADVAALLLHRGADIGHGQGAALLEMAIQNAGQVFVRRPREAARRSVPTEDAVLDARWRIITLLLGAGVSVHGPDSHALFVAAREGQLGVMELLLAKGASVNGRGPSSDNGMDTGETALMEAIDAWCGAREDERLLKDGTMSGSSLQDVRESERVGRQGVELLIARGANVNLPDARGTTPLMQCVASGLPALATLLLAHGAKVNAADAEGRTALMQAAAEDDRTLASVLLAHRASVHMAARDGATALSIARRQGFAKMAALLMRSGAKR